MATSESIYQPDVTAEAALSKSPTPTSDTNINRYAPPPFTVDRDLIGYIEKEQKPSHEYAGDETTHEIGHCSPLDKGECRDGRRKQKEGSQTI